ncbi:MAG: RT0821/Lpp0805 family surface protein [Alphaproteobacteria bacterium]
MKTKILTGVMMAAMLGACAQGGGNYGGPSDQTIGTVLGGVVGGGLGSTIGEGSGKTVAAILGTLMGAYIGSELAKPDQPYYEKAATQAQNAPVGQPVQWYNPETGNGGSITTTREGQTRSGDYCREFQQTITVGGKTEKAYGTACRQPDGSWKVVNQ